MTKGGPQEGRSHYEALQWINKRDFIGQNHGQCGFYIDFVSVKEVTSFKMWTAAEN